MTHQPSQIRNGDRDGQKPGEDYEGYADGVRGAKESGLGTRIEVGDDADDGGAHHGAEPARAEAALPRKSCCSCLFLSDLRRRLGDDAAGELAGGCQGVGDGAETDDVALEQIDALLRFVGLDPELVAGANDPRWRLLALDLDPYVGAPVAERQYAREALDVLEHAGGKRSGQQVGRARQELARLRGAVEGDHARARGDRAGAAGTVLALDDVTSDGVCLSRHDCRP